jgi:hypothetical protein
LTPDEFIDRAIAAGERLGVAALDTNQRLVYLIAEAESLSDMEGVDSFLKRYTPKYLHEAAAAFEAVGAAEIARELLAVPQDASVGDPRLDRLNALITSRAGYDFDAVRGAVAERLAKRCAEGSS